MTPPARMRAHGNATQWPEGTPSAEQLAADIAAGGSYVCEVDGRVVATFAFLPGPDECYDVIEDGQWRSDTPYAVLHRVASDGTAHGIAAAMFAFAKERADHLRIDTHQDNLPMQGAIAKAGFKRAGIVYVSDGTPRVALIGCARHKGRVTYQRFTEMKMAPSGAIFGKRVVVGLALLPSQMTPGRQKGRCGFARREPTKIAARQRGAMSSVGGIGPASPAGP